MRRIRLTESQLNRVIMESVRRIVRETKNRRMNESYRRRGRRLNEGDFSDFQQFKYAVDDLNVANDLKRSTTAARKSAAAAKAATEPAFQPGPDFDPEWYDMQRSARLNNDPENIEREKDELFADRNFHKAADNLRGIVQRRDTWDELSANGFDGDSDAYLNGFSGFDEDSLGDEFSDSIEDEDIDDLDYEM